MASFLSDQDSDESLMVRLQNGDHQAFASLVQKHTDRFFAVAYRSVGRKEKAEDIVQEAFLKLFENPLAWREERGVKFTTWFYRVVSNLCVDQMRKNGRLTAGEILEDWDDGSIPQDELLSQREQKADLEESIQALPDKQKEALNLCFFDGMSNKEAAALMGVNVKALESLLMRAKNSVRDMMIRKGHVVFKESA